MDEDDVRRPAPPSATGVRVHTYVLGPMRLPLSAASCSPAAGGATAAAAPSASSTAAVGAVPPRTGVMANLESPRIDVPPRERGRDLDDARCGVDQLSVRSGDLSRVSSGAWSRTHCSAAGSLR